MSDQYAVSIRHSYTMPDETFQACSSSSPWE